MSGIYIHGVKMPVFEHQSWDIRKGADGKWYMVDTNAETSDGAWHEIVPVPPHGKLIDVDVICKECQRVAEECDGIYPDCTYCPVNLAPAVIPAEEGEG